MSKFKIGDRVTHAFGTSPGTVTKEEFYPDHCGVLSVRVKYDGQNYASDGEISYVRNLSRAPKFKVGDRIRHIAEYWGTGTVVKGSYVENNGEMLVPVQYDNGKFCDRNFERCMQLIPALELEPALKPRAPFFVIDESDSLDHDVWSTPMQKPFMPYSPSNLPRLEMRYPFQYNKFDSNKLTEANKYSEEPSIYKSATDGIIPLSFKGRHLMQRLRAATIDAITFDNWHVFGEALSRARAAIAQRMGELESRLASAEDTNAQLHELKREITRLNETVKANEDFIQLQATRLNNQCDAANKIRQTLDGFQVDLNP